MEKIDFHKISHQLEVNSPLVHHITNYVTANDCANCILALGGSPVMADDPEEVEEMVSMSSVLVINLGTLKQRSLRSMRLAGSKANEKGIPVILDPVGAGATSWRTKSAKELLETVSFSFVRGNASEIQCLAGLNGKTRGVETAVGQNLDLRKLALTMATEYKVAVGITGVNDVVSDGKSVYELSNGHPFLTKITGSGCMTTSIIGLFLGAEASPVEAGIAGIATMAVAGELAYEDLVAKDGMGSYRMKLMDHLGTISADILEKRVNIKGGIHHG